MRHISNPPFHLRTMDSYIPPNLFPDDDAMSETSSSLPLAGGDSFTGEFGYSFLWTTTDSRSPYRHVDFLGQVLSKTTSSFHELKASLDTNPKSKVLSFDVSQVIYPQYCNLCSSRRTQMSYLRTISHRYASATSWQCGLEYNVGTFNSLAGQELLEDAV